VLANKLECKKIESVQLSALKSILGVGSKPVGISAHFIFSSLPTQQNQQSSCSAVCAAS